MKNTILIIILLSIVKIALGQNNWSFFEDTFIEGSISGSIEEGMIFLTKTNNYYRIDDRTSQRVSVRNPDVTVLKKGDIYKLVIEDFDEPVICEKLYLVTNSSIYGEFEGWDGETIIMLNNDEVWEQYEYEYEYSYSDSPEVWILSNGYSYFMKIDDLEAIVEVIKISYNNIKTLQSGIIESTIIDEFEGWEGETKFILDNGQVWMQESYSYMYHYAYRPSVKIILTDKGYLMKVEDVSETIFVKKIR